MSDCPSAPKADALPGCATPRTAEALRFPADRAQVQSDVRGNERRNGAGTCSESPGLSRNHYSGATTMTELKPCPFCGGEAWLRSPRYPLAADCDDAVVFCYDCSASGPSILCDMNDIDAENHWPAASIAAIAAWNTRADSQAELVEALEKIERHCGARGLTAVRGIARAALAHVKGEKA